jgi:hypothetical protein
MLLGRGHRGSESTEEFFLDAATETQRAQRNSSWARPQRHREHRDHDARGVGGRSRAVLVLGSGAAFRMRRLSCNDRLAGALLVLLLCGSTAARAQDGVATPLIEAPAPEPGSAPRRDVIGAIADSFKLVMLEHATRVAFQEKTRAELTGPFWDDYIRSVKVPRQWDDTDSAIVNYIGHPIHGAAAGIIWLDHSDRDRASSMFSPGYLASRGRAAAFTAVYSLQFEIGPLSQASIGNVGMRPETTGWVDYVVTPVGAFGLMIGEDVLDRYFVRWAETHVRNRAARATLRLIFGPSRFLANTAEGRLPWYRPERTLAWRSR